MKEFVENSASQRGECFESVLPQKVVWSVQRISAGMTSFLILPPE